MCDFHSICVRRDGAIAHVPQNSHSKAVAAAGWRENTDAQTHFVECEWNGGGEYSLERVVSLRNGLKISDLTNKQVESIERHYKALANVMVGDVAAIFPGGSLHGSQYWDVYLAAVMSGKTNQTDRDRIQRELITATVGEHGTATAGYKGTATAGDYGTATAGYKGTATAGDYGTATAGDRGTATAGYEGTATAGDYGTATAGYKGTTTAGDEGVLIIACYGNAAETWKRKIALVDGQTVKPNVPYRLNDKNEFEEVKS